MNFNKLMVKNKMKVFSFALFQAKIMALLGLIAGMFYSFGGLTIDILVTLGWITSMQTPGLSYGTILAFGALIGMPIIFAIFGFFLGIIEAVTYNLFLRKFIEVDFKK